MTKEEAEQLADKIVDLINGWSDAVELCVHVAHDGDGYTDFMRFEVRKDGRASLVKLLKDHSP
jgi:hypothetical protein